MKHVERIPDCTFDPPGAIKAEGHCDHAQIGLTWCCYCEQRGDEENFAPCIVRGAR
jgi:hypothetical protein